MELIGWSPAPLFAALRHCQKKLTRASRLWLSAIPGDAADRSRRLRAQGLPRVRLEANATRRRAAAGDADGLDALGVALLALGQPQEAEKVFRSSLAVRSGVDLEWAKNNLAVALKAQGRFGALERKSGRGFGAVCDVWMPWLDVFGLIWHVGS